MNASFLLTWLAGTLLPLGALWLVYRLALRGERCFGYNRALLLLAPMVAALWPLLPRPTLPGWLSNSAVVASDASLSVLLPAVQVGHATGSAGVGWSGWAWLGLLYPAGIVLGLGRLGWQAIRLRSLARGLPREVRPGYVLACTAGRLPTSSFGHVIFWDETLALAPTEATAVLAHELAHVRQHHTLDRLWLEAWRVVLWPNPFAHLLLPALRLTHELLADREAAASAGAVDHAAPPYPTLLARLAARRLRGPAYSSLLQPFTFSFTLTRIAMLQNQIPVRRWKQWLVLPVLGGLSFVTGHSANAQTAPPPPPVRISPNPLEGIPVEKPGKVYVYAEQMPQLPGGGGQPAIVKAIQSKIVYPKAASSEMLPTGRVFANFLIDSDGRVQGANIIKGLSPAFDNAVLAAVKQLPRFEPGKQNGHNVAVSFTVPIEFK